MESKHRKHKLADVLRSKHDTGVDTGPHLIIEAGPGTGKTTTLIEGIKRVLDHPSALTPSPQQQLIWETMAVGKGRSQTVLFAAFGRTIVEEISQRLPEGCEAKGIHSIGLAAVTREYGRLAVKDVAFEYYLARAVGMSWVELKEKMPAYLRAASKLADLVKQTLVNYDSDTMLNSLIEHYDLEVVPGQEATLFKDVRKALDANRDPEAIRKLGMIDYNDMLWLPHVNSVPTQKYDMLLVDEAQDLNRAQQQLVMQAGRRLIVVGDPNQAIYGFAGADTESMNRMKQLLQLTPRGCVALPLTETRRCGRAIVREANKLMPTLTAHADNPAGAVNESTMDTYRDLVQDGDLVVCRTNAPLVRECLALLKQGRKANILGRDISKGLIAVVNRTNAANMPQLYAGMKRDYERRVLRENMKANPSERRLQSYRDQYDCLHAFAAGASGIQEVINRIKSVFNDPSKEGVRFGTLHQAKGLEAQRVFFLMPKGAECPHPMARSTWEKEQERNLLLIGITRAISHLYYVT